MKKIVIVIFLTLILTGCNQSLNEYKKIDGIEAVSMIDDGAILIDVRTENEYNNSHIEGAINIPNTMLEIMMPKEYPDKDTMVIVYCMSGSRSSEAAKLLIDMGYINVYDLGAMSNFKN